MPNKPRVAVVQIKRGPVVFGVQKIQVSEGEDPIEKIRERMQSDTAMPKDVELSVVDYEDFEPQRIQVHTMEKTAELDQAMKTGNDPIKFKSAILEGDVSQLAHALEKLADDPTFAGVEFSLNRCRSTAPFSEQWVVVLLCRYRLSPEALTKPSGEEGLLATGLFESNKENDD